MSEREHSELERSKRDGREDTVGAILRRAREQRKLSVEDLGRALRLEPRVILHLEHNRFDQLPGAAFVRGYLRAIAKQLGIASEPLINQFDASCTDDVPRLTDFESRAPLQITSNSNIIRYTTVAVTVAMIVLVALWWRTHRDTFSMLEYLRTSIDTSTPVVPPTPLPYTYEVVVHPDTPLYRAPDPPPVTNVNADADADADAAVDVAGSASTGSLAPGVADIVIRTRANAWIQITDVHDERLYYNIVTPGKEVRIGGQRPYSLIIGNAPAVTLLFEGQPVDLASIANEGVARLQLGQNSAPSPASTPQ